MYVDASALVKLIVTERESAALTADLGDVALLVSSRIVAVEVVRAVARRDPRLSARTDEVLATIDFVEFDAVTSQSAARVTPASLRALDAIHLASAMALAGELEAFVTYDARLADAAQEAGLSVLAPA